jgi:FlaA1/EpsC-like NDP-sugar epimerase
MKPHLFSRNRTLFLGDIFLIAVSVFASFVLRLNFGTRLGDFPAQILTMIALGVVIKPLVYHRFGLYRRIWEYASTQEIKLIAVAVTFASLIMFTTIAALQSLRVFPEFPRAAVLIDYLLSLVFVGGLRISMRILSESQIPSAAVPGSGKRALIVGAGDAGALVVREMQKNPQSNLTPVCILDDDPAKQRNEIHGVRVVGTIKDLPRVVDTYRVEEVIFAIPSAAGKLVRVVADLCRLKGVLFRTMPGISELIGGKVSVSRLREVDITDLLRREPTYIDDRLVGNARHGAK